MRSIPVTCTTSSKERVIPTAGKRILLTGATGLLGGELAGRLVDRGHEVTALVHRVAEIRRNDGSLVDGARHLRGDVRSPGLGLDKEALTFAIDDHDLLIHCAAITGFGLKEEVYRAVNVDGTRNVVEIARKGAMQLLHVSTAYVCGSRDGPIRETIAERETFANPYEESKAEAERLVHASDVPAAIARPSIVVGEWQSGRIRCFDTIYAAFRLIAEGRIRTMPAAAHATLNFVPIDHVAAGLVDLAERIDDAAGGIFHLVSGAPIPIETFRKAIGERPGLSGPEFVTPERFDVDALPPSERRLHERVVGFYASYFDRNPRFDDSAFRALTGRACPPTGLDFLRRLIDYAIEAGLIRQAPDGPSAPAALQEA